MIAIMMIATTTVISTVVAGTSARKQASERVLDFDVESVGDLEQHGVELARFLADADHLQGKLREFLRLAEGEAEPATGLDLLGGAGHGLGAPNCP